MGSDRTHSPPPVCPTRDFAHLNPDLNKPQSPSQVCEGGGEGSGGRVVQVWRQRCRFAARCGAHRGVAVHLKPSLDALRSRSDVMSSIKILFLGRGEGRTVVLRFISSPLWTPQVYGPMS